MSEYRIEVQNKILELYPAHAKAPHNGKALSQTGYQHNCARCRLVNRMHKYRIDTLERILYNLKGSL